MKEKIKKKTVKKAPLKKQKKENDKIPGNDTVEEIAGYVEKDENALERGDEPMSIVGHLNEMRSRLITSLVTITAVTVISFFTPLSKYIIDIIDAPFLKTGFKLNVFNLSDGFILRAKASLIAAIFVGLPVIVHEIWKYIVPAIGNKDRKFIGRAVIASIFLFYTGVILTYFFLLPIAIQMLLSFTPDNMNNIIQASKYLNFVLFFGIAMGLMCELPIVIMILTKVGIITPEFLAKKRKYAIVIIWILAGILTPGPDILSQSLVAVPVMLLYEVSVIISKIMMKRKIENRSNQY